MVDVWTVLTDKNQRCFRLKKPLYLCKIAREILQHELPRLQRIVILQRSPPIPFISVISVTVQFNTSRLIPFRTTNTIANHPIISISVLILPILDIIIESIPLRNGNICERSTGEPNDIRAVGALDELNTELQVVLACSQGLERLLDLLLAFIACLRVEELVQATLKISDETLLHARVRHIGLALMVKVNVIRVWTRYFVGAFGMQGHFRLVRLFRLYLEFR